MKPGRSGLAWVRAFSKYSLDRSLGWPARSPVTELSSFLALAKEMLLFPLQPLVMLFAWVFFQFHVSHQICNP